MGVAGFKRGWTSVVVALGAIGAVTVITQSANAPLVIADPVPPVPFDANGYDDSFAIAQSREQGPVVTGKAATRTLLAAAAAAAGDPVRGTFGPQVAWPVMPIHSIVLPDGRVLSYGTRGNGTQTAYYEYDVWNPSTGLHSVLPNQTATDIFCSSHVLLLNGDVEIYGGDNLPADTNTQNRDVNQFLTAQNTLVRTGSLNRLRWYSTATVLPNAEVYIQGGSGGADFPERRTSAGQFQLLTGAPTGSLSSGYPKNFVAPDGLVFGIANTAMYKVNPGGNGSITSLGSFPTDNTGGTATSVMFAPGRILQVGGGPGSAASRRASIIDINGSSPQVTGLPLAQFGRHWGNATVMADGRVLVSGGSAVNNAATGVAYTSEIFDPATNSWTTGATATRMRLYHSGSLLLPDATVITMGGGTPGPETNLNAEIYYPPYLYNSDGTPAVRPTISSATTVTDPAATINIESPEAAAISRVSLVKLGAVTHSIDMDQRFLNLPITSRSGTTLQVDLPDNVNETPPGYYMIFVLDGAGVPSHAKIVRINVAGTTPPPPTTTTTTLPPTTTTSTTTTTTTLPPTTTSTSDHLDDLDHLDDVDDLDDDHHHAPTSAAAPTTCEPRRQRRLRDPAHRARLDEHRGSDQSADDRLLVRGVLEHRGRQHDREGPDRAGDPDVRRHQLPAVVRPDSAADRFVQQQPLRRVLERQQGRQRGAQWDRTRRPLVADHDVHRDRDRQRPPLVPRE